MIDKTEFINAIDPRFWKHITKDSFFKDVINYKDIKREEFLGIVADELNTYDYSFKLPYYLYAPKSRGVVRKVKIFTLSDISIYYYCTKQIQNELVEIIKSIPNVFGGFRITTELKLDESNLNNTPYDPYYENSLNVLGFRKEWSEYQKLAKTLYDKKFKYYIHIDIAHFYDDINLDILERHLRNKVNKNQNVIDLLFYFLKSSDKRDLGYNFSTVGIPQEEIGEMSRLLANFYLNAFDIDISHYLEKQYGKSNHIYSRYADDIWISFNGKKEDAQKIIQVCSFYLQKLKLNLNEQKIVILNRREYYNYWYFRDFDRLIKMKRADGLLNSFRKFTSQSEKNKGGRWFSPANYSYKVFVSKRSNIKFFNNYIEAKKFIEELINNPKLSYKVGESTYIFLTELAKKFPQLCTYLFGYLHSPKNIYPHTEFFILQFLSKFYSKKNKIEYFYRYYKDSHKLEYQWYSRVICCKYFIENINDFKKYHKRKIIPVVSLILKNSKRMNRIERRYVILFLNKIDSKIADNALLDNFNQVEDISFKHFIKH